MLTSDRTAKHVTRVSCAQHVCIAAFLPTMCDLTTTVLASCSPLRTHATSATYLLPSLHSIVCFAQRHPTTNLGLRISPCVLMLVEAWHIRILPCGLSEDGTWIRAVNASTVFCVLHGKSTTQARADVVTDLDANHRASGGKVDVTQPISMLVCQV